MRTRRQLLVFAAIGVVNSVIQYIVFLALFRFTGVPMLLASAIGYVCGVVNSYFMNRRWTFRLVRPGNIAEFVRFCLVNGMALAVNLISLEIMVHRGNLIPEVAQVLAIALSVGVNFVGNKWWTFKRDHS